MKPSRRFWRRLALSIVLLAVALVACVILFAPAVIRGQLHARYGGRVAFSGWWMGPSSAGLKNLALNEGPSADSPVWARADRVETDLSIGGILRGHLQPGRITLVRPHITFRLGPDGEPLTKPPLKSAGGTSSVPEVRVKDGQVTIRQEGRPAMVVGPVDARLQSKAGGESLQAETVDPVWGEWTATGRFEPGFGSGRIALTSRAPMIATPEKQAMIPFVSPAVWEHIDPRGPIRVSIVVTTGSNPRVVTTGDFAGTTLHLPTFGLIAEGTTGRMTIDGRVVTLSGVKGRAIGGTISASGTLNFETTPPRFDLSLALDDVDVGQTPKSWQLAEAGISGKLTGTARLLVSLTKDGADLTGSEGRAVIEGGTVGGIPVKSLKLAMKAEGENLKYETGGTSAMVGPAARPLVLSGPLSPPGERVRGRHGPRRPTEEPRPSSRIVEAARFAQGDRGPLTLTLSPDGEREPEAPPHARSGERGPEKPPLIDTLLPTLLALQAPPPQDKPAAPKTGGFVLPKSITTDVEFEDVDLAQVIARAQALGIPLPLAITGRLSLKAKATIPLGTLREVKAYAFHGGATLKGASIDGVDLGVVTAKVDLENGVLDLTEFQGRFVDRPTGGVANPPPALPPLPPDAPLPAGGFRGRLHAEISPPGALAAHFEGKELPIGELAAPALPRPTPLSGLVSFGFTTSADVAHLNDPARWTLDGKADAARITYRETTLDEVSTSFALKDGRASLPDFAAKLGGNPLTADLAMDAKPPYAFNGRLDVTDWDLDAVLAFVPAFPRPAPIGGMLSMKTVASGTLAPRDLAIRGDGTVRRFRAGPVAFGDVPVRWRTDGDLVRVAIVDARPFGGSISAEADIPARGNGPTRGSAVLKNLDVSLVSSLAPGGSLTMTGRADGKGAFVVRPRPKGGDPAVEGNLTLNAPDLTVQGVPARGLEAVLSVKGGALHYELFAESLGGKIKFTGSVPLTTAPEGKHAEIDGSLKAVGFRLEGLWKPLGVAGAMARFNGLAAIDSNLLMHRDATDLRARGLAEIRDLRWGEHYPIGVVKGTVTLLPDSWRIDPLTGDVLGGTARGSVVAERRDKGPDALRFNLDVDNASLKKTLAFLPAIASRIDGSGELRVAGRAAESLRADGEIVVSNATLSGLALNDLRAPADLEYAPGGAGALHVRRLTTRFAGGRVTGDATLGFGVDRSFQVDAQLAALDVENLIRVLTDVRRPASGKVSGKVRMSGPGPDHPERYRGRIDLDLDDASLVELPVFRELDRFLGAARGGIFEDGDLHATIANRQIVVESLTLEGRLVQLHGAGTVGFDTQLNLVMLVNTNQIVTQTGQALASLVGAADASGRRIGSARFANFLSNRLLKVRVTGTIASPSVNLDPTVAVTEGAVGFFAGVMKLPLELLR